MRSATKNAFEKRNTAKKPPILSGRIEIDANTRFAEAAMFAPALSLNPFVEGVPQFGKWSRGELKFNPGELLGISKDFDLIYIKLVEEMNIPNKNQAKIWLSEERLMPHHLDTVTIQLIPVDLHGPIRHTGSAYDLRNP